MKEVKQEFLESTTPLRQRRISQPQPLPNQLIHLSDSDSDSDNVAGNGGGFVDYTLPQSQACKQFWKAGDYQGSPFGNWDSHTHTGGMDHVRVHPKFLHSNATSHKWALGAFAELLDNSLDEVCNGATYVNVDMVMNKKDRSRMLLIEDDGGGMDPDMLRQCMSLGYSLKGKLANTIGQYGNGFKTSTMRLGADVIVFSRSCGADGKSTQSIGLLSYTFLRSTGKEDIVVPILDYERKGREWSKILRSSDDDWGRNVDTIINWSPYSSEAELLQQFNLMGDHGTRIIIYNLWEDDQGQLELDFGSDQHDIQIRGVNRDEKNIQMAKQYPNSKHFLTYRHSLRSYVSILYLRLPPNFRVILRGKDVEHHSVVNDMMMTEEVTYRPQAAADGIPRDTNANMSAVVTIGFVKDAAAHIDVQGFNVYHKNRLIKPFWRLWNTAGSDGRGVIGVLEANFVEPAHDKQGFERTTVLARLENKLVNLQRTYWRSYCHKIGYAPRYNKELIGPGGQEILPEYTPPSPNVKKKRRSKDWDKFNPCSSHKQGGKAAQKHVYEPDTGDVYEQDFSSSGRVNGISHPPQETPRKEVSETQQALHKLQEENRLLKERLEREEREMLGDVLRDLLHEKDKRKGLEMKLQAAQHKLEELNREQETLIDIFTDERDRRDVEEETLRKRLRDAANTIEGLREKASLLEKTKSPNGK